MKKHQRISISCGVLAYLLASCSSGGKLSSDNNLNYPITEARPVTTNYFGQLIVDPYQWLENTTAPQVLAWVDQQNNFTQNYFNNLSDYATIRAQVAAIYNQPYLSKAQLFQASHKQIVKGNKRYFYQLTINQDQQNHDQWRPQNLSRDNIIYTTSDPRIPGQVFLDLNQYYPDQIIQIGNIATIDNGKYLAFTLTCDYSDLSELHIIDTSTLNNLLVINNISEYQVWGNGLFFVIASKVTNPLLSSYNYQQLNYLSLPADGKYSYQYLFEGDSKMQISGLYSVDNTFYFSANIDNNSNIYSIDLTQDQWQAQLLIEGINQHSFSIIGNQGNKLLLMTNNQARRNRVIEVDPNAAAPANWRNILPELGSSKIVNKVLKCGNNYIVEELVNGLSQLSQYSLDGQFEYEIPLPTSGSIYMDEQSCEASNKFNFSFSNLVTPTQNISYNPENHEQMVNPPITIAGYNPDDYQMQQAFVPTTDNHQITIFIAYKKGLKLDGNNPTYIDVYGGFDYPLKPDFSKRSVWLLEHNGIYVIAQVRGGGEQGTSWYNEGRLFNKQNTYTDVINVAEYLISHNYTSPAKLALGGRSNGGLTTAAVTLQRPDLFAATFPAVGVDDLLRYYLFTNGYSWYNDYGYSDNYNQFTNMLTFSPVQNVQAVSYPAMYIQTGQQDTRVVPFHSYKLAATLQNIAHGPNPYLLDSYAHLSHFLEGHEIEEASKTWAFFFANSHTPLN